MTVGSFGFWASFFAGGQVVYAYLKNSRKFAQIDPNEMGEAFPNVLPIKY